MLCCRPHFASCRPVVRGSLARGRAATLRSPARSPRQVCRAASQDGDDPGSAWSRRELANRQLQVALADEDYALCGRLTAELAALEARLPPQKALLLALLLKLEQGDERERVSAAQALGDLGDSAALGALQRQLGADVGRVCEASMWSIFMKPPSAEVAALMARGLAALNGGPSDYEAAVEAFTQMTAAAPRFAEGWNKRATAYHLMQRNREAIEDCRATLQLNPMHFGAAAGMGMCCAAVKDYPGALAAFQNALEINPRLGHLRHHITQLQAIVQDQRGE